MEGPADGPQRSEHRRRQLMAARGDGASQGVGTLHARLATLSHDLPSPDTEAALQGGTGSRVVKVEREARQRGQRLVVIDVDLVRVREPTRLEDPRNEP